MQLPSVESEMTMIPPRAFGEIDEKTRVQVAKIVEKIVCPSVSQNERQAAVVVLENIHRRIPSTTTIGDIYPILASGLTQDDIDNYDALQNIIETLGDTKSTNAYRREIQLLKEENSKLKGILKKANVEALKEEIGRLKASNKALTETNRSLVSDRDKLLKAVQSNAIKASAKDAVKVEKIVVVKPEPIKPTVRKSVPPVTPLSGKVRWTVEEMVWLVDNHFYLTGGIETLAREISGNDADIAAQCGKKFGTDRNENSIRSKIIDMRKINLAKIDPKLLAAMTRKGLVV